MWSRGVYFFRPPHFPYRTDSYTTPLSPVPEAVGYASEPNRSPEEGSSLDAAPHTSHCVSFVKDSECEGKFLPQYSEPLGFPIRKRDALCTCSPVVRVWLKRVRLSGAIRLSNWIRNFVMQRFVVTLWIGTSVRSVP